MRWLFWIAIVLVAGAAYLFPLRIALDQADFDRFDIAMDDVSGTVWEGRIGDVALRDQSLGMFDARLDPRALLTGHADLAFARVAHPDGPLTGMLRSDGLRRGVVDADGTVSTRSLFAPLPIDSVALDGATVVFDGDSCAEASGVLTADAGVDVLGYRIGRSLVGDLSCDGEDVRVAMRSQTGAESIDLNISGDGTYRARMQVQGIASPLATALAYAGFRRDGGAMVREMTGRF